MRHDGPCELRSGGWHYASVSSRGGYPLGYCAEHPPHPTELAARECFARWQRDHVQLGGRTLNWQGCVFAGCDEPTKTGAEIAGNGYVFAALCEAHLTLECAISVLQLDEPAGDSWGS